MKIQLKQLKLVNFKGVRNLTLDFADKTDIAGDNATGKTTIFDAFNWLLFGKDSLDRTSFNIKTLDKYGKAIPKIDHEVTGIIHVDGVEITLKKVLKEKWTRRRGSSEVEFDGHETLQYYNDVPCQATEYVTKVSAIVNEGLFKLLTSTQYFNSLPWQKRREVLTSIAGTITDAEIIGDRMDLKSLLESLSGKSLSDHKKEIAAKKKKLKDDLILIPARIDELQRSKPGPVDYDEIEKQLEEKKKEMLAVEMSINFQSKAFEASNKLALEKQKELFILKTALRDLEFQAQNIVNEAANEHSNNVNTLKMKIRGIEQQISLAQSNVNIAKGETSRLNAEIIELRREWE